MLVLRLIPGEHISIGQARVRLHDAQMEPVRICIDAPPEIIVVRSDAHERERRMDARRQRREARPR